jgi:hypothetical protein
MSVTELQKRALTDKFWLATKILGYDFCEGVHEDLFAQYPTFDTSKALFQQSEIKHRLTLWSRGFYKTTSIVVEIIQLILNFPDISIMLMQSKAENTKQLLKEVKSHFDGSNPRSNLSKAFPTFCQDKLGTAMSFTVPTRRLTRRDPTVFVATPKSIKAGLHPDVGFFDDLVTEINYRNPDQMRKVIEDFSHYTPLVNPGGYFYVTGTRYTFGDLYEHIMREEATRRAEGRPMRWQISRRGCWTIQPDGTKKSNFPQRTLSDGRTIGITVEELEAIQAENPETFSAQYLNEPIAAGRQEFTEALLLGAVRPKETAGLPVEAPVLFVDLAEGQRERSDNRVIICGRRIGGVPTVCDLRSGQWTTLDIATNILEMCSLHRPVRVLIEGSPGSTFFIDYLKMMGREKGVFPSIDKIKTSNNKGAKDLRISAVSGVIKSGRLKFLAGLPKWTELVRQFIQWPKGLHDDEIDTIALMVQFYSGQVATFDPLPTPSLPFFLRQPGTDFSFESKIVQPNDLDGLMPTPEPIF